MQHGALDGKIVCGNRCIQPCPGREVAPVGCRKKCLKQEREAGAVPNRHAISRKCCSGCRIAQGHHATKASKKRDTLPPPPPRPPSGQVQDIPAQNKPRTMARAKLSFLELTPHFRLFLFCAQSFRSGSPLPTGRPFSLRCFRHSFRLWPGLLCWCATMTRHEYDAVFAMSSSPSAPRFRGCSGVSEDNKPGRRGRLFRELRSKMRTEQIHKETQSILRSCRRPGCVAHVLERKGVGGRALHAEGATRES